MITLHSKEVKTDKRGIHIIKSRYCQYNHRLNRNTFYVRWTTQWEGEFGRGYTRKDAIKDVERKVMRKRG